MKEIIFILYKNGKKIIIQKKKKLISTEGNVESTNLKVLYYSGVIIFFLRLNITHINIFPCITY